jgi:hypothetical protein
MQKVRVLLLLAITLTSILWLPHLAYADCSNPATTVEAIKCGADKGSGNSNKSPQSINTIIARVINIISSLVGVVAVIMIIIGGFRYITSANALIGLVIAVFAQVIVRFVLHAVK